MTSRWRMLALGGALLAGGCDSNATKAPEVRPVRTMTVNPHPIDDDRRAVGEVRPRYESELGFRVSGKVISRVAEVGNVVKKGDLLAQMDEQEYRNKVKSATAELVAAQAVLTEAQASEGRQRQLLATGATTRANYDAALQKLLSSDAKLEAARASLELANDQLSYCELRAEFDGIITTIGAEVGQVVTSGKMIVKVARPDDRDAVFSIAESAFGDRNPATDRPEIVVTLLSEPNISADGVVREISPVADPVTRTYQVKVTLNEPPQQMRFGGSVVGRLRTYTNPVVVLPGSALFDKNGRPAVWVVDPVSNSLGLKPVAVARYETDRVIVNDGLAKGDIVVTAGVNRLRENQRVRLADGSVP